MVGGLGQLAASALQTATGSDTLEGTWDQAASPGGGLLYFLKGDRMLAISYGPSTADLSGALRLASKAVTRLAGAH